MSSIHSVIHVDITSITTEKELSSSYVASDVMLCTWTGLAAEVHDMLISQPEHVDGCALIDDWPRALAGWRARGG